MARAGPGHPSRRLLAIAALLLAAGAGAAQDRAVTLTAREGGLEIAGELLDYDGEVYTVASGYGVLSVDAEGVTCEGAACPDPDAFVARMRVSGAPVVAEGLFPALVESFAARRGYGVERDSDGSVTTYAITEGEGGRVIGRFSFASTSSAEGFADLIAQEADLAIALREVSRDETRFARTAGLGDLSAPGRSRIMALDALVPLVAPANPLGVMEIDALRAIFSGEVRDWSGLTGVEAPISLHLRDELSGPAAAFVQRVLGPGVPLAEGITRHASAASLADAVARDPLALGIGTFTEVGDAVPVLLAGSCGLESAATEPSLKTEDYPLTNPVFIYAPVRRLPRLARDFLAYATSPAAQPVVARSGFVDQFPQLIALDRQGERFVNAMAQAGDEVALSELRRMARRLLGLSRLTLTFRFEDGSAKLDAQSRSNVALLAAALDRGLFDRRTLLFAGFSDGLGPASLNRNLSLSRAQAVRDAVSAMAREVDEDRLSLEVDGFGEAMPMACDDTDWGREVNRRVEVWLE